jgi:hypothetical protein
MKSAPASCARTSSLAFSANTSAIHVALAANTQVNCGSTYYIPLLQVDSAGNASPLPTGIALVAQTDATKGTAAIGTMPGGQAKAVIFKPTSAASGVAVTVNDSSGALSPGSALFDLVAPPPPQSAIKLDTLNMQSTTP